MAAIPTTEAILLYAMAALLLAAKRGTNANRRCRQRTTRTLKMLAKQGAEPSADLRPALAARWYEERCRLCDRCETPPIIVRPPRSVSGKRPAPAHPE